MSHDIYYFFGALFVFFIFGLKLDVLLKRTTVVVVVVISAALFCIGLIKHFPMVGYFWLLHRLFLRWVHREPVDTAMNWTPGLVKDRSFAFTFLFGSMFIIFVLTIGAERLAKAGW